MSKKITLCIGFLLAVFMLPLVSVAQKAITGRVVSRVDQSPIPGASISIKGTKTGTATIVDGSFSIRAKDGDVLVISGVGIVTQEQTVQGSDITISVTADARNLNEVVVTALGIKKEAKRLGYSVQEVKGAELLKAREPNPINGLVGKVAGLNVGINQELLSTPAVLLRGSPLNFYIVDGIPINSDTWNI
ncbi:MAG TPA: carboxypeptidase-like regulatory domain-containing protein, partial [Puia sp.]|nr:carboxypeptidase-like regulatory domain-containing protein [Puia sp.]